MTSSLTLLVSGWLALLPSPDELTPERVRALVPAASAVPVRLFNEIAARGETVRESDLPTVPLSLAITLVRFDDVVGSPEDFRAVRSEVAPQVGASPWVRVPGHPDLVTILTAECLSAITVQSEGERGSGSFRFRCGQVDGRATFEAQRRDGGWQLTAFELPAVQWETRRRADGAWILTQPALVEDVFDLECGAAGDVRWRGDVLFLPRAAERRIAARATGRRMLERLNRRLAEQERTLDELRSFAPLVRWFDARSSEVPALRVQPGTPFHVVQDVLALAARAFPGWPAEESPRTARTTVELVRWSTSRRHLAPRTRLEIADAERAPGGAFLEIVLDVVEPGPVSTDDGPRWPDARAFLDPAHPTADVARVRATRLAERANLRLPADVLPPPGVQRGPDGEGRWDPWSLAYRDRVFRAGAAPGELDVDPARRCAARLIRYEVREHRAAPGGDEARRGATIAVCTTLDDLRAFLGERAANVRARGDGPRPDLVLRIGSPAVLVWSIARGTPIGGTRRFPLVTKPRFAPKALALPTFSGGEDELSATLRERPELVPAYWDALGWNVVAEDVVEVLDLLAGPVPGAEPPGSLTFRDAFPRWRLAPQETPGHVPGAWLDLATTRRDDGPARHLRAP